MKKWVGYKTQMGTTLSSCSHFVVFELLHPRRQATVMWLVVFQSSSCLRILSIYFQPIAFGFCLLQHHLPAVLSVVPCGKPSGTECYWNTGWNFTCDLHLCCMEHCRLFSFPVPRNIARNLRLIFIRS